MGVHEASSGGQHGEVYVLAVETGRQRRGIGRALLNYSTQRAKAASMSMVRVETDDDRVHSYLGDYLPDLNFRRARASFDAQ